MNRPVEDTIVNREAMRWHLKRKAAQFASLSLGTSLLLELAEMDYDPTYVPDFDYWSI